MMWGDLVQLFTLDLAVAALAALVLIGDAFFRIPGKTLGWMCVAALAWLFAVSFFVPLEGEAPNGAYNSTLWVLFFKRVFLCAGALGVAGSISWLEERAPERQAEYYALMLLSLCGMMILPGAREWILFIVAFELMGIPLYVLAAWAKNDGPPETRLGGEAALKLYITGVASSAFTFFGLGLVAGAQETTAMFGHVQSTPLYLSGMLMILAGMGFKIGAVPFHFWIPDTYQGAPTPFVAFLSVAPKAGGLAALAIIMHSWGAHRAVMLPVVGAVAAGSMIVGNFFALPQTDLRRLLGFSGVAQIGYVLLALLAHTEEGIAMALFFIATYVFTNIGAFLVVHAAAEKSAGHSTAALAGLSRRSPWLGASLLVFLLSLAGIPFVAGFWAKLFVLLAAWHAGLQWLVVIGVIVAVIGLFYYLSIARSTFISEGEKPEAVTTQPAVALAIVVCLLLVVGLGLRPAPLVEQATLAARSFLQEH